MGGMGGGGATPWQKIAQASIATTETMINRQLRAGEYKAMAGQYAQQAKLARQQGEMDRLAVARQRSGLTRDFKALQSGNTVAAAAGNVDAAVGSTADVAMGNAQLYGGDIADNAYQQRLVTWGAENRAREMDAQAKYYSKLAKTNKNLLYTLLQGAYEGGKIFLS